MHWRETAQTPKAWFLDARAFPAGLIIVFYWSWETLYIGSALILLFGGLSHFGLNVPVAIRIARRSIFPALTTLKNKRQRPGRPAHLQKGM